MSPENLDQSENEAKTSSVLLRINSSKDDIVSLATELISIPSTTGQEGELARYVAELLTKWGLEVETFDLNPELLAKQYPMEFYRFNFPYEGRPNVLGKFSGLGGGRSLMINFHLDVVNADPAVWKVDPWKGTVQDGVLYGRGAADMKGGMASALFAVKCILDAEIPLKGNLILAGVIEEEGPGNGTLALQARGITADGCIIPEPTGLCMCPALTGGVYGFISVSGRSAHSTTPWLGVNALEKACLVVRGIEAYRNKRKNIWIDPLFAHVPEIAAGSSAINMIRTDGATIGRIPSLVQIRTRATVMLGEDPYRVAQDMEETIRDTVLEDSWFIDHPPSFVWEIWGGRSYPAKIPSDQPLPRTFAESFHEVVGRDPEVRGFVSPADMQHLINIKPATPTLMFGPGSIDAAHTDHEGVNIDEMTTASAVMASLIVRWCGIA